MKDVVFAIKKINQFDDSKEIVKLCATKPIAIEFEKKLPEIVGYYYQIDEIEID